MRHQKQIRLTGFTEVPLCKCLALLGRVAFWGWGQPVVPFCYHMKQISLWHAGAQEFTAAVKSQAPKTALPPSTITRPAVTQQLTSLMSVIMTKFKISKITDINFLVFNCNAIARSYRVSPQHQHCESYPVMLKCTDDSALWSFLTLLFTKVAKWRHVFSVSFRSPGDDELLLFSN